MTKKDFSNVNNDEGLSFGGDYDFSGVKIEDNLGGQDFSGIKIEEAGVSDLVEKEQPSVQEDYIDIQSGILTPEQIAGVSEGVDPFKRAGKGLEEENLGFFGRVKEELDVRGGKIGEGLFAGAQGEQSPASTFFQTIGQGLGGFSDVVGETVGTLASTIGKMVDPTTNMSLNEAFKIITSEAGEGILGAKDPTTGQTLKEAIVTIKEGFESLPGEQQRNIGSAGSIANFALELLGGRPVKKVAGEIVETGLGKGKDVLQKVRDIRTPKPEKTDAEIDTLYQKAIVPGVKGKKKTLAGVEQNKKSARLAIADIIDNKNIVRITDKEGRSTTGLPENLKNFSEAISSRKKDLFDEFDTLLKQSDDKVLVETDDIIAELDNIVDNPKFATVPLISKKAEELKEIFEKTEFSPSSAQENIKLLNEELSSFYRGAGTQADAVVGALVANRLRKNLDNAVNGLTGENFQALKSKYGNLSAIEKDVVHRTIFEGQKAPKGLLEMSDIFSAGDIARGMAGDPTALAKGVTQFGVKEFFKFLNNKDRMIKQMFKKADSRATAVQTKVSPESVKPATKGKQGLQQQSQVEQKVSAQAGKGQEIVSSEKTLAEKAKKVKLKNKVELLKSARSIYKDASSRWRKTFGKSFLVTEEEFIKQFSKGADISDVRGFVSKREIAFANKLDDNIEKEMDRLLGRELVRDEVSDEVANIATKRGIVNLARSGGFKGNNSKKAFEFLESNDAAKFESKLDDIARGLDTSHGEVFSQIKNEFLRNNK